MKLGDKGRCCGCKPLDYKRGTLTPSGNPHKFCIRCNRSYDRVTGEQIINFFHKQCACGIWICGSASACGECICEQDAAP